MLSKQSKKSNISKEVFDNLSKSNVKNSIKDYLIYFITLTFGICLLYTFNTIDRQFRLFGDNYMLEAYIYTAKGIIMLASIIISIIFAFLINYANQFLMRKRKKEFGIYITLGMSKRDIIKLMCKESIIIGVMALAVGIGIGIFVEQGLSVITADMLGFDNVNFRFGLSISALFKTLFLFVLVLWFINKFNKKVIKKYTLIELLNSSKKNEFKETRSKNKNLIIFIFFIISIVLGYWISINNNYVISLKVISMSILFISIGTYLFFLSISDFLIGYVKSKKGIYFKNLNMFIVSQVSNRIKSMNITMTFICLLLFLSMTIIPSGLGVSSAVVSDLKKATPYDATIYNIKYFDDSEDIKLESIKENLIDKGFPYDDLVKKDSEIRQYQIPNLTLAKFGVKDKKKLNDPIYLVRLSDYNNALSQQGLSEVKLNDDEYILNSNDKKGKNIYDNFLTKNNGVIKVNNFNLKPKSKNIKSVNYYTSTVLSEAFTIVVPDYVVKNLKPQSIALNITYPKSSNEYDNKFLDEYRNYKEDIYSIESKIVIDGEKFSINATLSYISIYLGIIFLVTAGAILALNQLAEHSINIERFNLLKKLGVREKNREKAIFTQVLTFFSIPLLISIIHSIVINQSIVYLMGDYAPHNMIRNIIITIVIVTIVYGAYFIVSYIESKRNIINN